MTKNKSCAFRAKRPKSDLARFSMFVRGVFEFAVIDRLCSRFWILTNRYRVCVLLVSEKFVASLKKDLGFALSSVLFFCMVICRKVCAKFVTTCNEYKYKHFFSTFFYVRHINNFQFLCHILRTENSLSIFAKYSGDIDQDTYFLYFWRKNFRLKRE